MTNDSEDAMREDIRYIRGRVDEIAATQSTLRERLAHLEARSGIWGALGGILAAIGFHFTKPS